MLLMWLYTDCDLGFCLRCFTSASGISTANAGYNQNTPAMQSMWFTQRHAANSGLLNEIPFLQLKRTWGFFSDKQTNLSESSSELKGGKVWALICIRNKECVSFVFYMACLCFSRLFSMLSITSTAACGIRVPGPKMAHTPLWYKNS